MGGRTKGTWGPGQGGNPSGRSTAAQQAYKRGQRYILDKTADGEELYDILLGIARSDMAEPADRTRAAVELLNRSAGKPREEHVVSVDEFLQQFLTMSNEDRVAFLREYREGVKDTPIKALIAAAKEKSQEQPPDE